ncbi:von Willebrand factor type A domain-containing protein [Stieleria sp.]|uniref:YfbK domain-containing protein n=1 Tax=Stieleria sp. TaxID=2795976 RepID=UPI00356A6744
MSDSNRPQDATDDSSVWDDARITAYVMGELSPQDAAAFEQSMAANDQLRAAVDQAGRVTEQLQTLFADEPPKTLDGERREQILAASASHRADQATIEPSLLETSSSSKRLVPWLLAAAASILLLIGIVPALKQSQVAQSQTGAPESEQQPELKETSDEVLLESIASVPAAEAEQDEQRMEKLAASGASDPMARQSVKLNLQLESSEADTGAAIATASDQTAMLPPAPPVVEKQVARRNLPIELAREAVNHDSFGAMPGRSVAVAPAPASEPAPDNESAPIDATAPKDAPATTNEPHPFGLSAAADGAIPAAAPAPAATPAPGGGSAAPAFSAPVLSKSLRGGRTRRLATLPGAGMPKVAEGETEAFYDKRIAAPSGDFGLESSEARLDLYALSPDGGALPYTDGDRFERIVENEFKQVREHPLSTFSIDVDTASYSKLRRTLVEGRLPRPDAVRIEELVNYFDYDYDSPQADSEHPFATDVTIAGCPWNDEHRLARVAIQGKHLAPDSRPPCNLVFLLDTSGSMNQPNKLPLVIEGMKMLTKQLGKEDRVAIVVYAGSAGMVLDSTPAGKRKKITKALSQLSAGGSTNGGAGIQLAYATARDHFIKDGVNRVILCTDGDFNVGLSGTDQLVRLIKEEASGGIFLTALGFGMGNHNDAMMEQISGEGNGNYAFIDTVNEAHKVLVRQTDATLVTIAKDVKIQIEFNRRVVSKYRLIGYENRMLAKEDFYDDSKDAGEIGAGHQVTALYELVLSGADDDVERQVAPLKYQKSPELTEAASSGEAMTVKLNYKQPGGGAGTLIELSAKDNEQAFAKADSDFRFAAAVAAFGMQLRQSEFAGDWTLRNVLEVAQANVGPDEFQLRSEFVQLVTAALRLKGE